MRVIVLNDGETFTDASGCLMLEISDDATDHDIKTAAFWAHSQPTLRTRTFPSVEEIPCDMEVIARF